MTDTFDLDSEWRNIGSQYFMIDVVNDGELRQIFASNIADLR